MFDVINVQEINAYKEAISKINARLDKAMNIIIAEIEESSKKDELRKNKANEVEYNLTKPLEVLPTYYWAPRRYEEVSNGTKKIYKGFTLYLCGGDVFHLYLKDNKLWCDIFDDDYNRYFADAKLERVIEKKNKEGKLVRKQIISSKTRDSLLILTTGGKLQKDKKTFYERLIDPEKISDIIILEIIKGFIRCTKGEAIVPSLGHSKKPYERYRENIIAHDNCNPDSDIQIVNMEFEEKLGTFTGKNNAEDKGKADLVGLSINKDNKEINMFFIEYKCTKSATDGNTSLPEHYQDMIKYYNNENVTKKVIEFYIDQMSLLGKETLIPDDIEIYSIIPKMMFLYSHVVDRPDEKNNIELKKSTIAEYTVKMMHPKLENGEKAYDCNIVSFMTVPAFSRKCKLGKNIVITSKIYESNEKANLIRDILE